MRTSFENDAALGQALPGLLARDRRELLALLGDQLADLVARRSGTEGGEEDRRHELASGPGRQVRPVGEEALPVDGPAGLDGDAGERAFLRRQIELRDVAREDLVRDPHRVDLVDRGRAEVCSGLERLDRSRESVGADADEARGHAAEAALRRA